MFFHFSQNNSGGSFIDDKYVGGDVIIEADSAQEANDRAEDVGLYFRGIDVGYDCECCGDRWYRKYDDSDGTEIPMIYNHDVLAELVDGNSNSLRRRLCSSVHIYYKDGRHMWFDGSEMKSVS